MVAPMGVTPDCYTFDGSVELLLNSKKYKHYCQNPFLKSKKYIGEQP
jgi:hypothetical protein